MVAYAKAFSIGMIGIGCGVGNALPNVILSANPSSSSYGQSVKLTATAADPLIPSAQLLGEVSFMDVSVLLNTTKAKSGVASLTTRKLSGGIHSTTATYDPTGASLQYRTKSPSKSTSQRRQLRSAQRALLSYTASRVLSEPKLPPSLQDSVYRREPLTSIWTPTTQTTRTRTSPTCRLVRLVPLCSTSATSPDPARTQSLPCTAGSRTSRVRLAPCSFRQSLSMLLQQASRIHPTPSWLV